MMCDKCQNDSVFFQEYSNRYLCGRHLALDIENRAKHTLRSHRWMRPGDHIAVPVSGRKSAALLCFLKKVTADRRDIRLSAVPACTGGTKAGDRSSATAVAESLRIPWNEMPLVGESGTAAPDKVTRVALAISLDDLAEGVLTEFLFGDVNRLVHPTPVGWHGIPLICPFIAVPSDELDRYWEIAGTGINLPRGIAARDPRMPETGALLEDYSRRHPATKYALLNLAEQLSGGNAAAFAVAGIARPCGGEDPVSPGEKTEQLKNSVCPL